MRACVCDVSFASASRVLRKTGQENEKTRKDEDETLCLLLLFFSRPLETRGKFYFATVRASFGILQTSGKKG